MAESTIQARIKQMQMQLIASSGKTQEAICAFSDEDSMHFYGECATRVAAIVAGGKGVSALDKVDGLDHLTVDLRYWNPAVEKIQAANEIVLATGF